MSDLSDDVISGEFAANDSPWSRDYVRVVTWNIERGLQFAGIVDFLRTADADVIFLQEVDLNARRTQRRDVVTDLARTLRLNFVFGKEFQELSEGTLNSPAYQGLAILSPWPLMRARVLRFQTQSQFWKPHSYIPNLEIFQRRMGGRITLFSEIQIGTEKIFTYNVHLESRGNDVLRLRQLNELLTEFKRHPRSTKILAGDFNVESTNLKVASTLRAAGFRDAVQMPDLATTTASIFRRPRSIDGIYVSGSSRSEGCVHNLIGASDHHPVSTVLRL